MEKLVGKLLLATGLLISGSLAFLPLTSHAMSSVGGIYDCKGVTNPSGGNASGTGAGAPKDCAKSTYEANMVEKLDENGEVVTDEAGNPVMVNANTEDGSTIIKVNVEDILALDAAAFDNKTSDDATAKSAIQAFPNMVSYGRIYANVRSAKPYTISLSAAEPALLSKTDDSFSIRAKNNPTVGASGWGVADGIQGDLDNIEFGTLEYKAISSTPAMFYSGAADDVITTTNFPVAVAISSNLPHDTYTTEVTVTAAVQN